MTRLSDKLIRVPELTDGKIQRVQNKLSKKSITPVPKYQAIDVAMDFYIRENT